jgi:hypothetical protein
MKIQLLDYDVVVQLDRANVILETIISCDDSNTIPKDNLSVLLQTANDCIKAAELAIENMGNEAH